MTNKQNVKEWILSQRLQNYGYDYQFFNKMKRKKYQLKNKIQAMNDQEIRRSLALCGILGPNRRLTRRSGVVNYTTGQSFNEELLNIMSLSASKGKKSFWEIQDKWSL